MLFHSVTFLIFFILFIAGFIYVKRERRVVYTTIASFVFYAWWNPRYLLLLIGFSLFAYYASFKAASASKKMFAILITVCLLPLIFFKYSGFLSENLFFLAHRGTPAAAVPWRLPLGISFITFTVLAYLIDIRRTRFQPEKNFSKTALYLSFFPHLIAGPIMRPRELFPQFAHLKINANLVKAGLLLFAVGMIKKIACADPLAEFVDQVYRQNSQTGLGQHVLAFYAFAGQIYFDFSGYTDMALGIAFILGIRLPLNFNRPYHATSIRDFWQRWHMTLSRWLRDYLYIPLGGNRHGEYRTFAALSATMLLGGLWHGASWTFVLWGGYHGALLCTEHLLGKRSSIKIPVWLARLWTFHVVAFGWIFFRAGNWDLMKEFLSGFSRPGDIGVVIGHHPYLLLVLVCLFLLHRWDRVSFVFWAANRLKTAFVYPIIFILILGGIVFSVGNPSAFIYFDF